MCRLLPEACMRLSLCQTLCQCKKQTTTMRDILAPSTVVVARFLLQYRLVICKTNAQLAGVGIVEVAKHVLSQRWPRSQTCFGIWWCGSALLGFVLHLLVVDRLKNLRLSLLVDEAYFVAWLVTQDRLNKRILAGKLVQQRCSPSRQHFGFAQHRSLISNLFFHAKKLPHSSSSPSPRLVICTRN